MNGDSAPYSYIRPACAQCVLTPDRQTPVIITGTEPGTCRCPKTSISQNVSARRPRFEL